MADYFVSSPRPADWSFAPDRFADELRRRWPEARVAVVPANDQVMALEWWIEHGERLLAGGLMRDGRTIHLAGDVRDVAVFAVWCRSLQPLMHEMAVWDEGGDLVVRLEASTEPAVVAAAFEG